MRILPLIKYPSTVVWIDDDELFLKTASRTFREYFPLKIFNSSQDGLNFLKECSSFSKRIKLLRSGIEYENYDTSSHTPVDLNLKDLWNVFLDSKKNEEISVAIVDYKMPDLDGISVCRSLKNSAVKKILLTGEADHQKAVDAFNEGIIDRFIVKKSCNLAVILKEHIDTLIDEYFYDNTQLLLSHLEVESLLPVSDENFISYFDKLARENNIKEHYIIDKQGSLCLIDDEKNFSYLIVHTEKSLDAFLKIYSDVKWAKIFFDKIKNREMIPFFGKNKEAWEVDENEWASCFYQPSILDGKKQRYFIAHVNK